MLNKKKSKYNYLEPTTTTRNNNTMEDEPEINVEVSDNGRIDIIDNSENLHTCRQLRGAVIAGGLTGLVVGGPVLGIAVAGGAALAVSDKGKVGEIARKFGEDAAKVGDRIRHIDQKHHISTKSTKWVEKRLKPKSVETIHTTPEK